MRDINGIYRALSEKEGIKILKELIQIPSTTGNEEEIARSIERLMEKFKFDEVKIDKMWNVYGRVKGLKRKPSLLISMHTDTSEPPDYLTDPYSPKILDGKQFEKEGKVVYGFGAASKCVLSAILIAAKSVIDSKFELGGDLLLGAHSRDLSANHDGIRHMIEQNDLKFGGGIIGETSGNKIIVGARGRVELDVIVKGKKAHSGNPDEGINAIIKNMDFLNEVRNISLPSHIHLGKTTLNVIDISCKVIRPMIPHECISTFDYRILPGEMPQNVKKRILDIIENIRRRDPEFSAKVKITRKMYPLETSPNSHLVLCMQEAGKKITGHPLEKILVRHSTDAAYLTNEFNVPAVGFGPSGFGVPNHVEVKKLMEAAKIYALSALKYLT